MELQVLPGDHDDGRTGDHGVDRLRHPRSGDEGIAGYLLGVAISTTTATAAWFGIATLLDDNVTLGDSSDRGSAGTIIQLALVALLVAAAIRNYVGRETIEPPKWLGALLSASPRKALVTGLAIIPLMPSDEVIMATVAINLVHSGASLTDAVPFIVLTFLVASAPLLGYLLFRRRAKLAMPKVRDWMNANSWLVNIIVCAIFIVLILG